MENNRLMDVSMPLPFRSQTRNVLDAESLGLLRGRAKSRGDKV